MTLKRREASAKAGPGVQLAGEHSLDTNSGPPAQRQSTPIFHAPATRARLEEVWRDAPAHLRPVIAAVRDCGVGMLFVPQDATPFRVPHRSRPAITILGDDFDQAKGPNGFHLPSVRRAIRESAAFAVIAAEGTPDVYAAVAAGAVAGGRVVIVETRQSQEIPWVALIQKLAPRRPLIWATVKAGRA